MKLAFGVVIALALSVVQPAHAQYTNSYGYSFNNPVSATANQFVWDGINRRLLLRSFLKKRGYTDDKLNAMSTAQMEAALGTGPATGDTAPPPPPATAAPAPKLVAGATKFKPAKGRVLVGPLIDSLVTDKDQRKALVAMMETAITAYEADAKKSGFDHDLSGAISFFIGASYMVYSGTQPPDAGLEVLAGAIRAQMSTAEMAKVSSVDKQKFYELMLVLGTFMLVGHQQAVSTGDTATATTLKTQAGGALKGFLKLDPDAFKITENGLELIKN
jgi:hypothetical protein